jgi:hypothetical protein
MMIVKKLSKQRHAPSVFIEVFYYLKILYEKLNLFLNSSSLKLVITVRTKFSDPRNEFPITRKLKTRFCNRAGDKTVPYGPRSGNPFFFFFPEPRNDSNPSLDRYDLES